MISRLRRLRGDERGATAVEYGLILALVVIAVLVALAALASESTELWSGTLERTSEASEQARN